MDPSIGDRSHDARIFRGDYGVQSPGTDGVSGGVRDWRYKDNLRLQIGVFWSKSGEYTALLHYFLRSGLQIVRIPRYNRFSA